ncbi:MAG: adenylyltransferase [Deltaproteobacteria bacterium CG_4_8_14_3_um_filter_51_11]|nr:HesA/MoeB/ThiF family protein [Deltaproteobacteria bacterium]PIX20752.1 MAG: adenylyltransferase [Deltaproteobacteria bacterium CG_4_8_14_3_um_filter_51_11]PIY22287.1 MAG: adenylyltransferase [Deltaproteobacteria bacterium CG_4_10_14_3_um_filter_51_14]PJB36999.1 MAG: adenylyltransferase [Deltaproteobacteria bacterium CG_4_9_14_3_um_filter_51_14]
MKPKLCAEELERYDRQIYIQDIGPAGQEKLKKAKIFICGVGGLGSPAAIYLAAAGIGEITLVDYDEVVRSNLNRQVLHHEADIGRRKVYSAKEKLSKLNAHVVVTTGCDAVTAQNAKRLVSGHDVIIDALDNPETRYILNKAALDLGIVFIHGAVNGFEGRIMTVIPGKSTCLRCLYRGPVISTPKFPVIGVAPAVIGVLQATEAIKYILGIGELLTDRLLTYDGLKLKWREFKVRKNPKCDHCGRMQEGRQS